jgi:hypothetical protein
VQCFLFCDVACCYVVLLVTELMVAIGNYKLKANIDAGE